MSNTELPDLPDKMRVHALARLLGRTSKEVLAALVDLDIAARSPQSSIDRKAAEQVVEALTPGTGASPAPPAAEVPEVPVPAVPVPEAAEAVADTPAPRARRRRAIRAAAPAGEPAPATAAEVPGTPAAADPAAEAPAVSVFSFDNAFAGADGPESSPLPPRPTSAPAEAALAPLFAPPAAAPLFQAPTRATRGRRRAEPDPEEAAAPADEPTERPAADQVDGGTTEDTAAPGTTDDADDADDDENGDSRRRRRRGRRGRGRGRGADDESDEENGDDTGSPAEDPASTGDSRSGRDDGDDPAVGDPARSDPARSDPARSDSADGDSADDDEDGDEDDNRPSGSRRRRRRRRRGSGDDSDAGGDADPPNTVTRVRAPRERSSSSSDDTEGDGVQGVRGSTRLEAKRQRRRDGRDAGRRRVPILSEAEFLARREAVDRVMVARERGDRVEIGVLEDDVLVEHFVADGAGRDGGAGRSMVGNIYLGRVQNVLPSMEAAFVDIGRGRNAVLYAGEVDWDAAGLGGKARRIEQALSSGDAVLVQVTKDPIGHKGARLTTQISLAGRFLVYVPSGGAAGISRKLPDVERKRLKDMLKEIVPSEAGVIIRTASEGVGHEALERDVRRLQAQWEVVKEKSEKTGPSKPKAPVLLYEEPDLLIKVVRDQFNEDFSKLVISGDDAWDTLRNYIGHVAPELVDRMHRHVGTSDVFAEYRVDEQLLKALDRKVWLPSGGTLVIDRTEAMTVVDVNTGKYTGSGGNLEETVTRNNLEAAEEVVRQLRLRDIGGIIVVDFIDMVLEANRDLVLRRLTECLSRDRTRHQVAEVTSLGLVQMTRKRVGGGLLEHFSTPCEHCRGRGVVVDADPVPEKADNGRADKPEGGGRRSRGGRGGRGGEDRNGSERNGQSRNGSLDAAVDVGAPAVPAAPPAPVPPVPVADAAADAVEEVAVEQEKARPLPADPAPGDPLPAFDDVETGADTNGHQARPARRRGRVTRTAGAPATEAPAAVVVTVPAEPVAPVEPVVPVEPALAAVPPQPEPAPATSRPRRARRTASRPAGPPPAVEETAAPDPV